MTCEITPEKNGHPPSSPPSSSPPQNNNGFSICSALFWFATVGAVLGCGFQHGYSLAILAHTLPRIRSRFGVSDMYLSGIVSGNALGAVFGALSAGYIADRLGRRRALLINSLFFIAGWSAMALATSRHLFLVGRVAVGFGVGAGSALSNMFLSEIAPVSIRGFIGTMYGIVGSMGTLTSVVMSMPQVIGDGDMGWRLAVAFPILAVLFQDAVLAICPETPPYLSHIKHDREQALAALRKYRRVLTQNEISDLTLHKTPEKVLSLGEILSDPGHRLALVIGLILHCSRQLSGISAVSNYTPDILAAANVTDPVLGTAGTGIVNVLAGGIAAGLSDRVGRRCLMITGLGVMVVSQLGIGVSQVCSARGTVFGVSCGNGEWTGSVAMVSVFVYMAGFAPSIGTILWLYVNEITSAGARGKTNTVCVAMNWGLAMVVLFTYTPIDTALQPWTFFMFAGVLTVLVIAISMIMPETSNKSVHEISREIREQASRIPPTVSGGKGRRRSCVTPLSQ